VQCSVATENTRVLLATTSEKKISCCVATEIPSIGCQEQVSQRFGAHHTLEPRVVTIQSIPFHSILPFPSSSRGALVPRRGNHGNAAPAPALRAGRGQARRPAGRRPHGGQRGLLRAVPPPPPPPHPQPHRRLRRPRRRLPRPAPLRRRRLLPRYM
jgi:hypothetical protein